MMNRDLQTEIETITGPVRGFSPLSGGSIHVAWKVEAGGNDWFLKMNDAGAAPMFETEKKGLELLARTNSGIKIPQVAATGLTGNNAWILMEYLPEEQPDDRFFTRFGHDLAALHRHTAPTYGLDHDNFIGSLPQVNTAEQSATVFMIKHRLEPQVRLALKKGFLSYSDSEAFEVLYTRLPSLIPDEPASLLHGDLWSGNYLCTSGNRPAIFDPAVYYGHRESDLAFTRLFGGYSPEFYSAYDEAWPIQPGFENRVGLYNVYPLLVHVNLFGGSYVPQTLAVLRQFV